MLPRITRVVNPIHIFQLMDLRFFQAMIRFVGYPSTSDTGEMFTLSVVKLNMVVNTRPFVNPHKPLTKIGGNGGDDPPKHVLALLSLLFFLFYHIPEANTRTDPAESSAGSVDMVRISFCDSLRCRMHSCLWQRSRNTRCSLRSSPFPFSCPGSWRRSQPQPPGKEQRER